MFIEYEIQNSPYACRGPWLSLGLFRRRNTEPG
jgi:hypothetical protein